MRSECWNYFEKLPDVNNQARCMLIKRSPEFVRSPMDKECGRVIKLMGGSTSAMKNHLWNIHGVDINNCINTRNTDRTSTKNGYSNDDKEKPTPKNTASSSGNASVKKEPKESIKVSAPKRSLQQTKDEILARAASVEGISVQAMLNSRLLQAELSKYRFDMPTTCGSIINEIMAFYNSVKQEYKNELQELKLAEQKFSLTTDEWKNSLNMKRYLNVTLHSNDDSFVLGLLVSYF